jgi:DnaJ-class molecular chaperone
MHLDEKQKNRANSFYNALKNFMSMKPDEYVESKVEICSTCKGTGLGGVWGDVDSGNCSWNGTDYCDKCYGVGFINIDNKFRSLTDELFICQNCEGVGCNNCNHTGLVDWVGNVMGGKQ